MVILLFELNSIVANVDRSFIGIKLSVKMDFLKAKSVLQVYNYENRLVVDLAKFLDVVS